EAAKKPTFRNAWKSGRCLIPAGGYYEWTGEKGHKQPHVILSAGNEETLWFAGLSSHWNDIHTCAILTRPANACVEQVHNRMPVILNSDEREAWMGGTDDAGIGADAILKHHPVKRFGMRDDGPELVEEM
ncbi:SOS response-associated peptidase, partial [Sedimentitalea nanhaiensis]